MGETGKHGAGQATSSTRRQVLRFAGSVALGGVASEPGRAPRRRHAGDMKSAIAAVIGDAKLNAGRVKLEIPPLVENGNTVPCAVVVESPMSASDYVKAIHVFNEKNPQPNVISAKLGPRAGRASHLHPHSPLRLRRR